MSLKCCFKHLQTLMDAKTIDLVQQTLTLFSVSEPTITNLPLMRKTSAKSVTTPSFRVTFVSTLCVDNVSLLRNGYANSRKPSKQSLP